ncbi:MAG: pyruvate:ferredoxin (flavodoxin) oxidoreductase, partial [Candidatus Omnitrophica bacterium]|nr:pyruvate:ferredoxin (flavodoxin) oxidoreductase [Candidatus Omnitrophota bacterium]
MANQYKTVDGNEAVASVAHRLNEVIAIYPITPSSPMGEWADLFSSMKKPNIWGTIPSVVQMQSEAGVAGAMHGSLQSGVLGTTFTASQGLLLMIPDMYKIAGELTPAVIHVSARSLATHALSIFGDHSDVMAARATGFALLASSSGQEAGDFALIAQAATLKSRVPFMHFFDGFRTSHEVSKIQMLADDVLREMIDDELVSAHRSRALTPDRPVLRGTAQNPDVYFQAREAANPYYAACAGIVQEAMDRFAKLTGRQYRLYEYHGAPDADRVLVIMGSGAETTHETVDALNASGEKVGVLKVRLYRPFDSKRLIEALPASVKNIAVLDRTKEAGSAGEPMYLDVLQAVVEGAQNGWGGMKTAPRVVGGRYGLSSKEFTPGMVKGVFDNLKEASPKNHFTIGIEDDVTHTSLKYDKNYLIRTKGRLSAIFYGLGSDGTVGANKNSIKIIGENTENFTQGYFVYDSKKAGAVTVSHLRFGPEWIRSPYLVDRADFVACHQPVFLERFDMLSQILPEGTFLLNTPFGADQIWAELPRTVQETIIEKKLKFYVIDAYRIANETGMGGRINTVMQACFFAISGVLPREQAIAEIHKAIKKSYGKKGDDVVKMNIDAVNKSVENMNEVKVPATAESTKKLATMSADSPEFIKKIVEPISQNKGNELPVSAFSCDGTFPTATTRYEKRNLALSMPVWESDLCIQCAKCSFVCPHAVIRAKAYDAAALEGAPEGFKSADIRNPKWKGKKFTIQASPEDCTGCGLCVEVCPAKDRADAKRKAINMTHQPPIREEQAKYWEFFSGIPETDRRDIDVTKIREQQVMQPLFEFSGACAGCGETAYVKLVSQLFGDRMLVANATGCSSIYGGNLPTTPWSKDREGRGPAWSNSLFEDNAEFGLGMRAGIDKQLEFAGELLKKLSGHVGDELAAAILGADQKTEAGIQEQRERVRILKEKIAKLDSREARLLIPIADY